jgi:arginase
MLALQTLGVAVREVEVEPVDDFQGDIGRSFELFRRTARLVTAARNAGSFPVVLSGNCSASVGVLAGLSGSDGLKTREIGCIWFDAHDDYNVPDTVLSGYFDSMPIAIMAGECWKALVNTIPGYRPLSLERLIHCGLRDFNDLESARVAAAGYPVVWGKPERQLGYEEELFKVLDGRSIDPAMIHVDLDCLGASVGQVNQYEPAPGGLSDEDLLGCLKRLPTKLVPLSLTVASFDPLYDKDDRIVDIATRVVTSFVKTLIDIGILLAEG